MNEITTSVTTREIAAQTCCTASDLWRDTDGTPIVLQDRVEQVAYDEGHRALPSQFHQRGQVLGLGSDTLYVRFEDDNYLIALRPDHVCLLGTSEAC